MTYTIAVCTVKTTPDDGQRNSPKHVEFYSKNKFEKLVHLVGLIIRMFSIILLKQIICNIFHSVLQTTYFKLGSSNIIQEKAMTFSAGWFMGCTCK